jgi:hypothetical protein
MVTNRQRKIVDKQVDKARTQARKQMDASEELQVLRRYLAFISIFTLTVVLTRIYLS